MISQNQKKVAETNKENGTNGLSHQSKDKNTSIKDKLDESPKDYVIVDNRRKKQIINISSSESEAQTKAKETQQLLRPYYNSERIDKTKKIKKTVFKCQLCKHTGKKSEMKNCSNCKHNIHITCIDPEDQSSKKFICDKCKYQKEQQLREQQRKLALQQKQMQLELQKLIPKKTQKEKKKEQFTKKMNEFSQRYPYYVQDDQKLKYPIQDKLLIIYKEIFQTNESPKPKPSAHPLIPSHEIADFMQIENFFSTFREELQQSICELPNDMRKDFLYIALNSDVIDEVYSSMVYCLLKIYLSDIFDKNKTDNVKMLNENCFFTLLTNMYESEDLNQNVIVPAAEEIIRYLSTIPSMKKSFEDFIFPVKYNRQSKIYVLVSLIKGLSEIDTFHEFVSSKSEKMQNLTKEKGQLVSQLKTDEADNLSNKEKIKQFVSVDLVFDQQLNKNDELGVGSIASTRQITREKDKNKRKIQKLANEKDKSQRNILQIKSKIGQITKALPFVTSQIIFIGKDRNESQYFFYCNEPHRIYCKYRSFLLDDGEDYFIYQGKESITELLKTLNTKGANERHLAEMITGFVKDQIIKERNESDEEGNLTDVEPYTEGVYQDIKRQDLVNMIMELEETFSNYLTMKNLQWTQPEERENFLANIKIQTNLQDFKKMVIGLQQSFLFVEPMSEDSGNRRVTIIDSDQEDKQEKKQSRKKSPVRLWGINSQRIKKYWIEYLQECVDFIGIWICIHILKNYVDRYVKKKLEFLLQQQKKEQKIQKKKQRHRLRKQRQERWSQKHSRQRSREQRPRRGRKPKKLVSSSEQQMAQSNRPNLRQRKKKKFQIDSDIDQQEEQQYECEENEENDESSQSEDKCQICGQYGDMICCDTCPKVFHLDCLKIKQIPVGQWNCVKCLQKLANQRTTRSKAHQLCRMSRY